MSHLTNYTEEQIGNHLLRTSTWAKPINVFLGLLTGVTDGEAGTVTEVTGGSYARIDMGPDDTLWTAPSGGNKRFSNASAVTFAAPTADWHVGANPVSHFGLWDASTGGVLLAVAPLTVARFIYGNDPAPVFDAGALRLQFSGAITDYLVGLIGDHLLRTATWAKPTDVQVGLSVAGVEVSTGGYVRKDVGPADANWNPPTSGNGQFGNASVISWSSPTADWGAIDSVDFYDASTAGNKLLAIPMTPKTILNGALPPNFPINDLKVTVA